MEAVAGGEHEGGEPADVLEFGVGFRDKFERGFKVAAARGGHKRGHFERSDDVGVGNGQKLAQAFDVVVVGCDVQGRVVKDRVEQKRVGAAAQSGSQGAGVVLVDGFEHGFVGFRERVGWARKDLFGARV